MTKKIIRQPLTRKPASVEEFIQEPEAPIARRSAPKTPEPVPHERKPYPWEDPALRTDVLKSFNIRLSEPMMAKLKFLMEHTPGSAHSFCKKVIERAIDRRIREIIKG